MNKRTMSTIDAHTKRYLKAMVDHDQTTRTWSMATIAAAWKYLPSNEVFVLTGDVHAALIDLELSVGIYTRVHKSDIIIESNGGENGRQENL